MGAGSVMKARMRISAPQPAQPPADRWRRASFRRSRRFSPWICRVRGDQSALHSIGVGRRAGGERLHSASLDCRREVTHVHAHAADKRRDEQDRRTSV
jgi:hypothetical protein